MLSVYEGQGPAAEKQLIVPTHFNQEQTRQERRKAPVLYANIISECHSV